MNVKAIIGLGVLMAVCSGCATTATNSEYEHDPVYAAHLAIGHNDERLMALPSIDIEIPGITGDQNFLYMVELKFGVLYTDGTSPGEIAYAKIYNHEIMQFKGCNPERPMDRCAR